jgi:hypothetical protein
MQFAPFGLRSPHTHFSTVTAAVSAVATLAADASTAGLIQIGASANALAVPKPTSAMSIKLRFIGLSLSSLAWITYNPR